MSARAGLSLMPEPDWIAAALPLLAAGEVDVLEWSPDLGWGPEGLPPGLEMLLAEFERAGALVGHGVHLSIFSARDEERQRAWLARLADETARRRYARVSEHYGWATAGGWRQGAPLPPPLSRAALAAGRAALERLAESARAPVGLENLALAFGADDVARQGELLEALLAPLDGFLVLDLHNLHCQARNFRCDPVALMERYPLARVRELHVSGGSWSRAPGRRTRIRRDTHDGPVPSPVLDLLAPALARCPRVDAVILEHLGGTLASPDAAARLRADFRAMKRKLEVIRGSHERAPVAALPPAGAWIPDDAEQLDRYQRALLTGLRDLASAELVQGHLRTRPELAPYHAAIAASEPAMLEVARGLVHRWGRWS